MKETEATTGGRAVRSTSTRRKNREHSRHGRRTPRTVVSYDDIEWVVIVQAAAVEGLRPGAFVSRAALDAARVRLTGLKLDRTLLAELHEAITDQRNQLAKIGANLNDVAKHANSTHEVETVRAPAQAILAIVLRRVNEAEQLQAALRHALR